MRCWRVAAMVVRSANPVMLMSSTPKFLFKVEPMHQQLQSSMQMNRINHTLPRMVALQQATMRMSDTFSNKQLVQGQAPEEWRKAHPPVNPKSGTHGRTLKDKLYNKITEII